MKLEPRDDYPWQALATYNAERARGLVHSSEWAEYMATEQQRFDHAHKMPPCPVCGHDSDVQLTNGRGERVVECCLECLPIVNLTTRYGWRP